MSRLFIISFLFVLVCSCTKSLRDVSYKREFGEVDDRKEVDDREFLKPKGGYSKYVRPANYIEEQEKAAAQGGKTIEVPTGLTAVSIDYYNIALFWNSVPGAIAYDISKDDSLPITVMAATESFAGLQPGTTYSFKVRAIGRNVTGSYSAYVYETTPVLPLQQDTQAPTSPTNLHTVTKDTTSLTVAADTSTDNIGVAGYKFYWRKTGELLDSVIRSSPQNQFTSLQSGTQYEIYIKAFDAAGNISGTSNLLTESTLLPPPPPPVDISKIILFLQFDNDTITNPEWTYYTNGAPIISGGSGFTQGERDTILNRVTTDFAQWPQYNITQNRSEYDAQVPARRLKEVFAQNSSWYGSAGGTAYRNALGYDIPCWVFSALLSYNLPNNRIVSSHEFGHAAGGCSHSIDVCGDVYGYDGEIMGAPYGKQNIFWSYHLIFGCGYEDHPAMMNSKK